MSKNVPSHDDHRKLIFRRTILLIVLSLFICSLFVCSCNIAAGFGSGSDFARLFLSYISNGEYDLAYPMIETSRSFTLEEFVSIYKDSFDALKVTDMDFTSTSIDDEHMFTAFNYKLTYKSELCGDITDDYRMLIVRNGSGELRVQWSPSLILPEMEWDDTIRATTVQAERGNILANGLALASNTPAISVSVSVENIAWSVFGDHASDEWKALEVKPSETPEDIQNTNQLLDSLSSLLSIKRETLMDRIAASYNGVSLIGDYYPDELSEETINELSLIENVRVSKSSATKVRYYPEKNTLAHIIGYVQYIDATQLENLNSNLDPNISPYSDHDQAGYAGLEKLYESKLRGKDGYIVYIRSRNGINRRTIYSIEPNNGLDLELTIDPELQLRLDELMQLSLYKKSMSGAAIVMNPNTGAIQAMASYPSYNLNLFAAGISNEEYKNLMENYNAPFFNRALQSAFPPGSTYKPLTAAAALTYNTIDPDEVFDGKITNDYWTPEGYGTWIWPAIKRTAMISRTEPLNMRNALLNSDNIYFAKAALDLGDERMEEFWNKLGLNEVIDFDLSVAQSQYSNKDEERNPKLLADSGYGQATMLVTPIQMACTYCAFANGGNVMSPYIVDGLYRTDENGDYVAVEKTSPHVFRENAISKDVIAKITPMLCDVVDRRFNGTGRRLNVKNCVVAGKTGTAEIGSDKSREIGWFVGFRTGVSDEDARLVLVALELPTDEDYSYIKFDIARELLEMPAPEPSISPEVNPQTTDQAVTPSPESPEPSDSTATPDN